MCYAWNIQEIDMRIATPCRHEQMNNQEVGARTSGKGYEYAIRTKLMKRSK